MSPRNAVDAAVAAHFDEMLARGIASLQSSARRGYSATLFDAAPIVDRWTMPSPLGGNVPIPVLQVSPRRPDVADLARVVCAEGGDGATVWSAWRWLPGHGLTADRLALDVKVIRPVHVAYLLAFTLPRDRWILDAIDLGGSLGLTGAPRGDGPLMVLALPVFAELRRLLPMIDEGS